MPHDWQPVGDWWKCANDGCTARSKTGTSRGECRPQPATAKVRDQSVVPNAERIEAWHKLHQARENCRHRGEPLQSQDGATRVHRCGCQSSELLPIHWCAIHGECVRKSIAPPAGVTSCDRCKDAEAIQSA